MSTTSRLRTVPTSGNSHRLLLSRNSCGPTKTPIQSTGAFQTEDQIRHVMIDVTRTGQPVYIGDIADVERMYKDPTQYARSRGERAILLSVETQEGNNIVDFGHELHVSLDSLRPVLPPDLKIDMVADQPSVVAQRVKDFVREFGTAIASVILVTIVLLPFRVALVSAVAIPVTVAATFGLLNAFGIELHQVSIAALIVVLGMVVDDAIVIADNYIDLLDHGVNREEAAWRSASELAIPVLTATLTIICSFLPFLILSGATGEFIRALPLTVAIALSTSFLVAMLLTPLLAKFFIRKGLHDTVATDQKKRLSPLDLMQKAYNRIVGVAMRWKSVALSAGVLAVIAGALVLQHIPQRFFPFAERDQFVVDVWLPEGWKVEATDSAVRRIEAVLQHEKEVVNYTSFVGSSAPRFYYNVNPQLPDKNYAQVLVATQSRLRPGSSKLYDRSSQRPPRKHGFFSENCSRGPSRRPQSKSGSSATTRRFCGFWGIRFRPWLKVLRVRWTCIMTGAKTRTVSKLTSAKKSPTVWGSATPTSVRSLPVALKGLRSRRTGKAIVM